MEARTIIKYEALIDGIFVRKVNRFICEVVIGDIIENVHIKTTGRLTELLHEGAAVLVEPASSSARKTKFSLIAVAGKSGWVNVDAQLPNKVMWQALTEKVVQPFGTLDLLRKEVKHGGSRFDLYYERGEVCGFVEVKGVTFAAKGVAKFPDAPSERARKHVGELIDLVQAGYEATIVFVVQVPGCQYVAPYEEIDPAFAKLLREAATARVRMLAYEVSMVQGAIEIVRELPVRVE